MTGTDFSNMDQKGQIKYLTMKDGIKIRTACWPSKGSSKGIIVMVQGHREFMEKYTEFFSDILDRDFALYALDNRGQGLSDRLLPDRLKSHAETFDVFSSDLDEFITRMVMTDPRARELPIYLMAHSMGGHICLRYLHDFPGIISKAVLMAPMIGFNLGGSMILAVLKGVIRFANHIGLADSLAFGQKVLQSKDSRSIKQKLLTHDDRRYADEAKALDANPDLYVGGATFGWLKTALDSMEKIHQPGYLNDITTPLLVILAGDDRVVNSAASRVLLSGYDDIDVITITESRHEIYREADQYRDQLWQKIDGFLAVE